MAFKKKNLAISRPACALLGRSSIALSSSSILFHMKDQGVPSMANPFSGIMIHWIIISSASPSTRAASPAVLLNQIDPISHNLDMISSNFFFFKAIVNNRLLTRVALNVFGDCDFILGGLLANRYTLVFESVLHKAEK